MDIPKRFEDYELGELLGRGGMGVVYKAYQISLDRQVAIKFFPPDRGEEQKKRFLQEARIAARLNHPGIVSVYAVGVLGGRYPYFVMEYVEGKSLKEILDRRSRLSYDMAVEVAIQVAEVLDFAHERETVHRDIKPANLMITSSGYVKILDFGLAKVKSAYSQLTAEGTLLGTPYYMAPEQIEGKEVDGRTDIYALGIVLYEMTVGRRPFEGEVDQVILYKHLHEDPPSPFSWIPDYPKELWQIILRCVEKDRTRRFSRAKEVLYALQSLPQPLCAFSKSFEEERDKSPLQVQEEKPRKKPISRELKMLQQKVHRDTVVWKKNRRKAYGKVILFAIIIAILGGVLYFWLSRS